VLAVVLTNQSGKVEVEQVTAFRPGYDVPAGRLGLVSLLALVSVALLHLATGNFPPLIFKLSSVICMYCMLYVA
jgi:hypothetical protein